MGERGIEVRDIQEVFEKLEALCKSPGYIHALAFICYRDGMLAYSEQLTAEDMSEMFRADRLIRTETSTLIGLMIKGEMDLTLPVPATVSEYIERSDQLLKELHQSMFGDFASRFLTSASPDRLDTLSSGSFLREPMFYSGESAYSFQFRDLAPDRYSRDSEWLWEKKGFSLKECKIVAQCIQGLSNDKLIRALDGMRELSPELWTCLPGFTFKTDELVQHCDADPEVVERIIDAFSMPPGPQNQQFRRIHDFNVNSATPIIKLHDGVFVLLEQYSLLQSLYESPIFWMREDPAYTSEALENRGQFTERFAMERLSLVLGRQRVFRNVKIYKDKADVAGEIDVLALIGNRAIILQAKSKTLTIEREKAMTFR